MDEEIEAIERNDIWNLVDLPKDKNLIGIRWVYKRKLNEKVEIDVFKARLVAKGFLQQPRIYFGEMFALVARLDTIRAFLATSAQIKWKVYQMDVKSSFLNGILEEEIYVQQLLGYEVEGNEEKVYKLKKALYGVKQARRIWYSRIDSYMIKNGFCKSDFELDEFKSVMMKEFAMTDLGLMKYFLSIEVEQSEKGNFICQNKYAKDLSKRFGIENSKHVPTLVAIGTKSSKDVEGSNVNPTLFKILVGNLMYLTATRPDIMQGMSLISKFMETPKDTH
eukprot:PITA_28091